MSIESSIQQEINNAVARHTDVIGPSILSYINAAPSKHERKTNDTGYINRKKQSPDAIKLLKVIATTIQMHQGPIETGWQSFIWDQLSKITKVKKNLNTIQC